MGSLRWPRLHGILTWMTRGITKSEQNVKISEISIINKLRGNSTDCEFRSPSPLQKAAMNYDHNLVNKLLEDSEDITNDLMQTDNCGTTAFYYVMKNCPSSIEKLLSECITFGDQANNYEIVVQYASLSLTDDNIFFEEICKMNQDPSLRDAFERVFLHPTTEAYFFGRWSQIKYAYYMVPLFCHFIYSIAYSSYAIIIYRHICNATATIDFKRNVSYPNEVEMLGYATNLEMGRKCTIYDYDNKSENIQHERRVVQALISWILILVLTALIVMQEICKFLYYRAEKNLKRYFCSMETASYIWLIISVVLINFHQDPFRGPVVLQAYQYHAAAVGVFSTWVIQMLLMRRIPKVGMYIQMLRPVSATFFQFFSGYVYLFAGFGCSFYILFPDKYAFKNDLPAVFIKVGINSYV